MRDYCGLLGRSKSRNREAQQVIYQSVTLWSHRGPDRGTNRLSLFIDGESLIALNRAKIFKIKIGKRIGERRLNALKTAPPPRSSQDGQPDARSTHSNTVGMVNWQGMMLDPARLPLHSSIVELSIPP